jgi:predicted transcriptional regulator
MTFQRVQRELSAEEIARLHELRAEGKRLKWLAHEFGISHQTVSRYLRDRRVGTAEELPEKWVEAVRAAKVSAGS